MYGDSMVIVVTAPWNLDGFLWFWESFASWRFQDTDFLGAIRKHFFVLNTSSLTVEFGGFQSHGGTPNHPKFSWKSYHFSIESYGSYGVTHFKKPL